MNNVSSGFYLTINDGTQIQVMWQVDCSDTDPPLSTGSTVEWFLGTLYKFASKKGTEDAKCTTANSQGRPQFMTYRIDYEPSGEFPESSRMVHITSHGKLYDLEENTFLDFKFVDPELEVIHSHNIALADSDVPEECRTDTSFSMQDILLEQQRLDAIEDQSVHDLGVNAFGELPLEQQSTLATGYAEFVSRLKEKLKGLSDGSGDEKYTVTKDDMDKIIKEIKDELNSDFIR